MKRYSSSGMLCGSGSFCEYHVTFCALSGWGNIFRNWPSQSISMSWYFSSAARKLLRFGSPIGSEARTFSSL